MAKIKPTRAPKPLHIYCKTFRLNFWISYGVKREDYIKQFNKYVGKHSKEITEDILLDGRTLQITSEGEKVWWIWTEFKHPDTLAHECLHAAHWALSYKGMDLCDSSEEAYAYLISRIVRETLEYGRKTRLAKNAKRKKSKCRV